MEMSISSISSQVGLKVLQTQHATHNLKNISLKQNIQLAQANVQANNLGQAVQGPADIGANLDVFA